MASSTYQMMESYWPGMLDANDEHTPEHARWYRDVAKIVASRTLTESNSNLCVVGDDIVGVLRAAKLEAGRDLMIFASPTLTHTLIASTGSGRVAQRRLRLAPHGVRFFMLAQVVLARVASRVAARPQQPQ